MPRSLALQQQTAQEYRETYERQQVEQTLRIEQERELYGSPQQLRLVQTVHQLQQQHYVHQQTQQQRPQQQRPLQQHPQVTQSQPTSQHFRQQALHVQPNQQAQDLQQRPHMQSQHYQPQHQIHMQHQAQPRAESPDMQRELQTRANELSDMPVIDADSGGAMSSAIALHQQQPPGWSHPLVDQGMMDVGHTGVTSGTDDMNSVLCGEATLSPFDVTRGSAGAAAFLELAPDGPIIDDEVDDLFCGFL
jgi:hypothetical protein